MTDLIAQVLPALKDHRLPGLELGEGSIYPNYTGRSILNLPSSVCRLLGAPDFGAAPLAPELLARLGNGYRRVILVLMDALSLHRLQRWISEGTAPVWRRLAGEGLLAPLTSITPCTTSAALISLWSGLSAGEHGVAGYELWLKEYGVVANMITHSAMTFEGDAGGLARAGFKPDEYLVAPTLGAHLSTHGVKVYAMQHHSLLRSGLSQVFLKQVKARGFGTSADLWINLRQLVEQRRRERQYIWVYWGEVDHFSHFYGPDDERPAAEFSLFSHACEQLFLQRLDAEARRETLFILTADHGQIATRPDPHYDLRNHPGLARRLHIQPTGENRLAYLFVRPGQMEAVREYVARTWPNQFTLLDPAYAVEAGLFGPGRPHPRLLDRLGDLILAARGEAYLWWADKENHLLGRHGGLSEDEMLVPFLAAAL